MTSLPSPDHQHSLQTLSQHVSNSAYTTSNKRETNSSLSTYTVEQNLPTTASIAHKVSWPSIEGTVYSDCVQQSIEGTVYSDCVQQSIEGTVYSDCVQQSIEGTMYSV